MDFMEELSHSHGFTNIYVVVDQLTKCVHFIPITHPYTAQKLARIFMKNIIRLHRIPKSIVSDCESTFTGYQVSISAASHPQSVNQTEFVNKGVEQYLKCYTEGKFSSWSKWLPVVE